MSEMRREEIVKWKSEMYVKGLKTNTGKMNIMFCCTRTEKVEVKKCISKVS